MPYKLACNDDDKLEARQKKKETVHYKETRPSVFLTKDFFLIKKSQVQVNVEIMSKVLLNNNMQFDAFISRLNTKLLFL